MRGIRFPSVGTPGEAGGLCPYMTDGTVCGPQEVRRHRYDAVAMDGRGSRNSRLNAEDLRTSTCQDQDR